MRPSLVVFAALLGGVNAAQSQSPAPFADSITITATAAPEKRSEVTATVDVIPAEEIADRQAAQLLETVLVEVQPRPDHPRPPASAGLRPTA